jgi:Tat protein translocase TatB subunit
MGDIGFSELVAIVIIAILIYGKDLPQAARKMANLYTKFRRQLTDIKDELRRQIPDEEIRSFESTVNQSYSDTEPPQPPTGLSLSPSAEHVIVSWMSSMGATSYTVKRSTGAGDPYLVIAMYLTDLSYTDTDIAAGKTYHYVVTASNTAGESGDSEEAVTTLPVGAAPASNTPAVDAPAAPVAEAAPPTPPAETPGPAPAGGI